MTSMVQQIQSMDVCNNPEQVPLMHRSQIVKFGWVTGILLPPVIKLIYIYKLSVQIKVKKQNGGSFLVATSLFKNTIKKIIKCDKLWSVKCEKRSHAEFKSHLKFSYTLPHKWYISLTAELGTTSHPVFLNIVHVY